MKIHSLLCGVTCVLVLPCSLFAQSTSSTIQEKFDDVASLQNWKLVEAGKMELAGALMAPFEGKDSLQLIPENPVQDKPRTILKSNQKVAAAMDSTITVSFAVRGDGQGQGGYVILDCFDESGKLLKAIWKPLPVSSEWKPVKVDCHLDEASVGSPNCASVGLRIMCNGEGSYYLDDLSVSKKVKKQFFRHLSLSPNPPIHENHHTTP